MIAYFILGLALLLGTILLMRWYVSADPKQVVRIARWTLAGLGISLGIYLMFAGRNALALLALPALIPLLLRYRELLRRMRAAGRPRPGQTSEISTRFVRMVLDHDSGAMGGEVLEGRFTGRTLDQLSLEELIVLWHECASQDEESASVLEAYLDRSHGEAWREVAGAETAESSGSGRIAMSLDEAYEILGLEPGASKDEIRAAHHRLMQKLHPDHGGSNYLAAKINQAKDLLLGG